MNKIKKVLILGSGALQIGQAGEFDYSGSQAIKALKEEGREVILVNPNIATIQTSKDFADRVYFLPVDPHFVQKIIKAEKPEAIMLSFGGQTALNCGLSLAKTKVLEKYKVQVLGTPIEAIEATEDRHLFAQTLKGIGLLVPKSRAVKRAKEAKLTIGEIPFPVIVRGAFSLGGQDSQVCWSKEELEETVTRALSKTSQALIEEYLDGWKEIEYEVVRDKYDNTITVCNMENVDPMGIHTGESIVVAPSQTLNNFEYHTLREIAIKVIRHLGIVGECNIQFALNPQPTQMGRRAANQKHDGASFRIASNVTYRSGAGGGLSETDESIRNKSKISRAFFDGGEPDQMLDYRIIEVNARLSRSSALASKATGYPLAYVAAKLALGYGLTELKNSVTKKTIACFEPALDYLVVKIPRWDLGKFVGSASLIGSSMQSVGEVMAIGRKFEEAIQKATRMLDLGFDGILDEKAPTPNWAKPTPWRIFSIAKALARGMPIDRIGARTGIDPFFLAKIKNICDFEKRIKKKHSFSSNQKLTKENLLEAKKLGTSDARLAKLTDTKEDKITRLRHKFKIRPVAKLIDTLAAEYPAETNYLYLTYNGESDDISNFKFATEGRRAANQKHDAASFQIASNANIRSGAGGGLSETDKAIQNKSKISRAFFDGGEPDQKVIVLGSGPYRIGSSVEFDWCSVTCAQIAQVNGLSAVIINCNPETVSTDYDRAQRLYFEELTTETVLEIYKKEKPIGIIVSMGGQTPNNLVMSLAQAGVKILGTSPAAIDNAEDRHKFSSLCDRLGIDQPIWNKLKTTRDATRFAQEIGYPVLVRPSYVLSGAAMNVAYNGSDLAKYLKAAAHISRKYPVVISKFHENAKEIEIDAVARAGKILIWAISEHVENAGVHSGDSTMVLPAQKIYLETEKQIIVIAQKIARSLAITGPFNMQFLAKNNKVMVIECNLRASRSFPFVSKVTGINFVEVATETILGQLSPVFWRKAATRDQRPDKSKPGNWKLATSNLTYVGVKAPQFSFARVRGADPILRVEMASTGEVACFGKDIHEAFLKSLISTGVKLPEKSVFISLGGDDNKHEFLESAKNLQDLGLKIYATAGTTKFLLKNTVATQKLYKIHEHKKPNVLDFLLSKKIDLVVNIVDPYFKKDFDDEYEIRRAAVDFGVPILTNMQTAKLFVQAISQKKLADLQSLPWNAYVVHRN